MIWSRLCFDLKSFCKVTFDNESIFEWDIIIEKISTLIRVGVSASEKFNYESGGAQNNNSWVINHDGDFWNSIDWVKSNCPKFGDGAKITVHLDMNKRTLAFTVNGIKYQEVSGWNNNLPSKLYPVVSLNHPSRIRIQPHQK